MQEELSPDDSPREIVNKVFGASKQALEETLAIADIEAYDRAADFIAGARQRDFYGVGGSAQIARDVAHKFLRIGVRASVFDDAHMMAMSASCSEPADVAIGFSHSGATLVTIEAFRSRERTARARSQSRITSAPRSPRSPTSSSARPPRFAPAWGKMPRRESHS